MNDCKSVGFPNRCNLCTHDIFQNRSCCWLALSKTLGSERLASSPATEAADVRSHSLVDLGLMSPVSEVHGIN